VSHLFGWIPSNGAADATPVVELMAAALRVDPAQRIRIWSSTGIGIGVVEPPALGGEADDLEPATSAARRFLLWMAGEAYASGDPALPLRDAATSRTRAFRCALLERWLQVGVEAVRRLDGEYHVAVWDAEERTLSLVNDRFGGLPLYWTQSGHGFAFAGGVRGALMAPGVSREPDHDALREAASFGGYRLGDRTNVASVRMVDGATLQQFRRGARTATRYWTWRDVPAQPAADARELVPVLHAYWQTAVARRITDRARYGQTLSGGLDSRAILAEAARGPEWTAITYGLPGCDDARYARRAAEAMGASWVFVPLYEGAWLQARSAHVQSTDGLIELGDLMHLESLPAQRSRLDINVSGYIGDAVSGPTFAGIRGAEDVLHSLPWYGASLSLPYDLALARVQELIAALDGAPPRFATMGNKLPQSTNRWTAAWRPWLRVRKPFVDYAFFDFCQGLPTAVRLDGRLHERWLRAMYPHSFASIPNQKTGVPVMTPRWRMQAARLRRGVRARLVRAIPAPWQPAPRIRSYHDNDRVWRLPATIDAIAGPILRADAISAEIFGRDRLTAFVDRWRATAGVPAQVIGALYVYETYHAGLGRTLSDAAAAARQIARERQAVRA
jgi:hypothetical protein